MNRRKKWAILLINSNRYGNKLISLNFEIEPIVFTFDAELYLTTFPFSNDRNIQELFHWLTWYPIDYVYFICVCIHHQNDVSLSFSGRILYRKKTIQNAEPLTPLSVFLTIRNDEDDLQQFLPKLLNINIPGYEVIVVDDYSQDNSFLVLGAFRKQYSNLKISTLNEETRFSVKLSQNIAIKAAKNDWVLYIPLTANHKADQWILCFSGMMNENNSVVIAYSQIKYSAGYYNLMYRIENYFSFLKSVGYILNGMPIVYSEENVAFRKKLYFETGGYGLKIKEPFANLELLLSTFIRKKCTTILFSKESSIEKTDEVSRNDYYDFLKKNIRIENHLSRPKKLVLYFDDFTRLLLPLLFVGITILLPDIWILYLAFATGKIICHLFIIKISQNRLNERKIFISSLAYDLIMPYYKTIYRWCFNNRSRKNKWRSKV